MSAKFGGTGDPIHSPVGWRIFYQRQHRILDDIECLLFIALCKLRDLEGAFLNRSKKAVQITGVVQADLLVHGLGYERCFLAIWAAARQLSLCLTRSVASGRQQSR